MAFVATQKSVNGIKCHSIGPVKVEYYDLSAASGDTSGTISCSHLRTVDHVVVMGVTQTALPAVTNGTTGAASIALAFSDPLATVKGHATVYGR